MSYYEAEKIFQDIKNHVSPQSDPVAYNLSSGLYLLTRAIRNDLAEMQDKLARLEAEQRRSR